MKNYINRALGKHGYEIRKKHDAETAVRRLLLSRDVRNILDIGANQGSTIASWRRNFPTATIWGFEPVSENFGTLRARFQDDRKVRLNRLAIGAQNSQCDINLSAGSATHSFRERALSSDYGPPRADLGSTESVQMTTLDDWLKTSGLSSIEFCKIDVEGLETDVLLGAETSLGSGTIDVIMIEMMFTEIFKGQGLYFEICERMAGFEYELYDIPYIRRHPNGQMRWGDAIFLSKDFRYNRLPV